MLPKYSTTFKVDKKCFQGDIISEEKLKLQDGQFAVLGFIDHFKGGDALDPRTQATNMNAFIIVRCIVSNLLRNSDIVGNAVMEVPTVSKVVSNVCIVSIVFYVIY